MSEFRGYLQRLKAPPDLHSLSPVEQEMVNAHFDPHAAEVYVDGRPIDWRNLDEVEVVQAARMSGLSGWLVGQLLGADRFHVGLYWGKEEAIIINVSHSAAQYIVQSCAYYAPNPVRYKGIEGLSPIAHAS